MTLWLLRGSYASGLTDVISVVLTWQWSLKIPWSQTNCPLHICPYAKEEPAVLFPLLNTRGFSLQCFWSQSSTSLLSMIYRSLKVFTSDVFPSRHMKVVCFFTLSPSCSLVSIPAVCTALVSVSHQSWLTNNDPYAMLSLSHQSPAFSYVSRSRHLCRELRFLPVTDHLGKSRCWTLKWGTRGSVSEQQHQH